MKNFRSYIAGLLLLPVLAVIALFYIPGPDGRPLMNMAKLKQSLVTFGPDWSPVQKAGRTYDSIKRKLKNVTAKASRPGTSKNPEKNDRLPEAPRETLYKWRDKSGSWHFSNQPPPDGIEYETVARE